MVNYKKLRDSIKHALKEKVSDKLTSGVDLPSHTVEQNRYVWEKYDWSKQGEEWTDTQNPGQSKESLVQHYMLKYIKKDSNILEIGPGGGRWTEYLQPLANHLTLVDITPKCIEICKERFKDKHNIDYNVISDIDLSFVPDNSLDYIWSYNVFVHVNPSDTEKYVKQFARIMKDGSIAIIQHPGNYYDPKVRKHGWKSSLNADMMKEMVVKNGFTLIVQDKQEWGDVITIFKK